MRKSAVILAVGLALAGAVLALAWPLPSRVTRANFDRIKEGMSRADVEALLGPPGDYTTAPTSFDRMEGVWRPGSKEAKWEGDECMVVVDFDASGHAVGKLFSPGAATLDYGPVDRLLWRLERRWETLVR
jgi:hypothetical protein